MNSTISSVLRSLRERFYSVQVRPTPPSCTIEELVDSARAEWASARSYFETVTDPELVDHAIYLVEAAERKYAYMIRKARERRALQDMTPRGRAGGSLSR
ncbi:MAG: YaaL family protein [Actinobacteria bacterium]|nr:YaaL family protein [Actinomycetota bacterium]